MDRVYFLFGLLLMATACSRTCTETALQRAFQYKNEALVSGETQVLRELSAPQLNYSHSNCWTENQREFATSPLVKGLIYQKIEVDSIHTTVADKTGLVTGQGTFHVVMKEKPLSIHLCFTETYVCQDGHWKILARHAAKL
ncbi:MAG: nuclear transport factor 2 family protein [Saprospiraceae bacterium]|nr:nuclear transport factor 2 family protein [Saprospiraceae bacterium]